MKTLYKFDLYWKCCISSNGHAASVQEALIKAKKIAESRGDLKDFLVFIRNPETKEFHSFSLKNFI